MTLTVSSAHLLPSFGRRWAVSYENSGLLNFYVPTHVAPEHVSTLLATILSKESSGEVTPRRWTLFCSPKHLEMGPPVVKLLESMPPVKTGEEIEVRDVRLTQDDEKAFSSALVDLYGADLPDEDDVHDILTKLLAGTC